MPLGSRLRFDEALFSINFVKQISKKFIILKFYLIKIPETLKAGLNLIEENFQPISLSLFCLIHLRAPLSQRRLASSK